MICGNSSAKKILKKRGPRKGSLLIQDRNHSHYMFSTMLGFFSLLSLQFFFRMYLCCHIMDEADISIAGVKTAERYVAKLKKEDEMMDGSRNALKDIGGHPAQAGQLDSYSQVRFGQMKGLKTFNRVPQPRMLRHDRAGYLSR